MTRWEENIGRVVESGVPHVSAYSLTVEERTALAHQVKKGDIRMPPDETAFAQYEKLISMLNAAGIEQYELSNFAKPGFRSQHNGAYWQGVPYLGLGPSAHSFEGETRSWNISNHTLYAKMLAADSLPIKETETLSPQTRLNEYMMTHLRILEGINPQYMHDHFQFDIKKEEGETLAGFIRNGWMQQSAAGNYFLTTRGLFVSDGIISDLFQVGD
jgi:oxygen-independent coproporphyrinogen-3 oxidase